VLSIQDVRNDIPILNNVTYMDCAATSPIPRPVFESMKSYWEECPFNFGRSLAFFKGSKEVSARCNQAIAEVAGLLGADAKEIVFTKNTTEAINIVAHGLNLGRGDEVVISNIEHQSNFIPWLHVSKQKGFKVIVAEASQKGIITPEEIERIVSKKTRLVSINHASNIFGSIQDVETITRIVHDNSGKILFDAAQSAGRLPIDVKKIDCDFMAICGRKSLMGPQGTGALYGKYDALEELSPHITGGGAADLTGLNEYTFAEVPHRFHAGIYNAMGIIGMGRAAKYVGKDIGVERIRVHVKKLFKRLWKGLEQMASVKTYGPSEVEYQNGVVSFNIDHIDSREAAKHLDEKANIIVAGGSHGSPTAMQQIGEKGTVRASLQYYNTEEEVDLLLSTLEDMGV